MKVLILDTSVLSCFARAGQLGRLRLLTEDFRVVTTPAVLDELRRGSRCHPELEEACELAWIEVDRLETIEELVLFAQYSERLVAGNRNWGEAEVLAKAESIHGTALTDDQVAVQLARSRDLRTKRTLFLIATGVRKNLVSRQEAVALVDDLIEKGGARFPCSGEEFLAWATANGLLNAD